MMAKECFIKEAGRGPSKGDIFYESKEMSRIYHGQHKFYAVVRRHPDDKRKWTVAYGQARDEFRHFNNLKRIYDKKGCK